MYWTNSWFSCHLNFGPVILMKTEHSCQPHRTFPHAPCPLGHLQRHGSEWWKSAFWVNKKQNLNWPWRQNSSGQKDGKERWSGPPIWQKNFVCLQLSTHPYKALTVSLPTEGITAFAYKLKHISSTYIITNIENGLQKLLAMYSLSCFQRSNSIKMIIFSTGK